MVALKLNEYVVFATRPHGLVLTAWLVGIAAFAIASALLLPLTGPLADGEAPLFLIGLGVLLAGGAAVWDWNSRRLILTNRRLIQTFGILGKKRVALPLTRIQDVSHRFGIIGYLLGYGDLMVESAGLGGQIVFRYVPNPERAQAKIEARIRALRVPSDN